jgi:hypothetical protein
VRKSTADKIRDARRKVEEPQVISYDDLFLLLMDPRKKHLREASPTQWQFLRDPAPFKAFMGRKGSGKTSTIAAVGFMRALLTPGSKGLVARNDYNDLKLTTKLRFEEMLRRLPKGTLVDRSKDPPEVWTIKAHPIYHPETGALVSDEFSTITFAGLEMLGEGGSYEFDWAALDEASEFDRMQKFTAVNSLMRNLPTWWEQLGIKPASMYSIMMSFNPTDVFHWIYLACTGFNPQGRKIQDPIFKLFTPGDGENQRNLPADYYERAAKGMTEDEKDRKIHGKWGFSAPGAPVLRQFKRGTHEREGLMTKYLKTEPLFRFWDFGYRHPYVVYSQFDWAGRLLHLYEVIGENEEIEPFVRRVRTMEAKKFPGHGKFIDHGDPAARQRKDTGSTLIELQKMGIQLNYQIHTIETGLKVMRLLLERVVEEEPVLQYDREGCPILIRALAGGYHLNEKTNEPVKDGVYDHPVDADRYGIVDIYGVQELATAMQDMPVTLEYNPMLDTYGSGT